MENLSPLQAAAYAVCDKTDALAGARARFMVAIKDNLDLPLVAVTNGKAHPFLLADYAFHPAKGGKRDQKLRSAQLNAIMVQGCGQPEDEKPANAVKTAFAETFPAAMQLHDIGGVTFDLERNCFDNLPLAYAFPCYSKDGKLTETGKAIAAKAAVLAAGFDGEAKEGEEAIDLLWSVRIDNVGGIKDRRFDMKTEPVTNVIRSLKAAAIRNGLVEDNGGRAPRNTSSTEPSATIKTFRDFLAGMRGEKGEAKTTITNPCIEALKALKAEIDATIKAVA